MKRIFAATVCAMAFLGSGLFAEGQGEKLQIGLAMPETHVERCSVTELP